VEENEPVLRSIEGWEEGFVVLYILLSLTLVSLVSEREKERLNERNSPLLSCALAIEVFCALILAFRFIAAVSPFRFTFSLSVASCPSSPFTIPVFREPNYPVDSFNSKGTAQGEIDQRTHRVVWLHLLVNIVRVLFFIKVEFGPPALKLCSNYPFLRTPNFTEN